MTNRPFVETRFMSQRVAGVPPVVATGVASLAKDVAQAIATSKT
ncbi:hypothetical protein [Nostoc sp.]